ncbi:N-acetylglutamate synthase [Panacagrimonas perspica]|uniref:Amino-acid acetyltransferase n=1 Tax=Panacagrimonas perspica TaxID=381431 RepID=A0A4S3K549_9GAMM|nr:amino-acid N-acetyltransferase [Panacagrimonas perspica]TDU31529.1 N-acetylglutamate synthase [Panacagrimonas perspica]THD03233.1 amino-acid N-acetyltransferase [Panacagrimonas perspica]
MLPADFVAALRAAAPYVHAHNGRVFVVAFGGEVADRADFETFVYDLALLHSLGVKLVLVHGARPQIDRALADRSLSARYCGEFRVTDMAALECVKAAVGSLRMDLEAKLSTSLVSTPMGGARIRVASGNWVTARPVGIRNGVDFQHTGEVRRIDTETIRAVLEQDRIALVSPVGYSPTGEIFNLRAADVATAMAVALRADKLVFVSNSDPDTWKLADDTGDAGQLSLANGERLLAAANGIGEQDRLYLGAALAAGRGGVKRVHLVGAEAEGALLRELYTRDGVGLMLYADEHYEAVREASIEDVGGILALIKPLEDAGVLVPRSREQLELEIGLFDVMVRDGLVVACCALFPFAKNSMAEFSCVAVHPEYRRSGRAAALLARSEETARKLGIKKIFSLTTHTPHWFLEHGFAPAKLEDLPVQRQQMYNWQRNSAVLIKTL